jgi:hypothetical protein
MENKESRNENQAETPSKVKNTVNLIVKIIIGLAFLLFICAAIAHKYGG